MSGGSWDYFYGKIRDAGERLIYKSECPARVAFGKHLLLVSEAMHDIEWVDSSDYAHGDELEAIRKCISPASEIDAAVAAANKALEQLTVAIESAKVKP